MCGTRLRRPVYASPAPVSVSSLGQVLPGRTEVYFCKVCGHLVTPPLPDLASYYEEDYRILVESEEEDQLYELSPTGERTYRADHQLRRLLEKVPVGPGARLVDWGCAKAATFRRLAMLRPDLDLFLFDVSKQYLPFWDRFVDPSHRATHVPPAEWEGTFDLVTSFFSLEHVAEPRDTMAAMATVLAPCGRLYFMVPDTRRNAGDFVVADHVNHFTPPSLQRIVTDAGLRLVELDDRAHEGAFVVIAEKPAVGTGASTEDANTASPPLAELEPTVRELATYWQSFGDRVRAHEAGPAAGARTAIYGSGFYGTFIATCLRDLDRVAVFVDQNPYRQKQTLLGKAVVAPEALPRDISHVYIGLNPRRARDEVAKVEAWRDRALTLFLP